jgi:hypothetical protein
MLFKPPDKEWCFLDFSFRVSFQLSEASAVPSLKSSYAFNAGGLKGAGACCTAPLTGFWSLPWAGGTRTQVPLGMEPPWDPDGRTEASIASLAAPKTPGWKPGLWQHSCTKTSGVLGLRGGMPNQDFFLPFCASAELSSLGLPSPSRRWDSPHYPRCQPLPQP